MATTGIMERWKGKVRAHVLFLGTGGIRHPAADAITAHAGGTRAAAVQLGYGNNRISVCATLNDSVALPAALAGSECFAANDGAADAKVYAKVGTSDTIDGVAAATGVALVATKRAIYKCVVDGKWISLVGA